jgi:hypothetical protein
MENPITIEGKEYEFEAMSSQSQKMVKFITGIDAQLDTLALNMEQLQICREGCHARLLQNLDIEPEEATPAAYRKLG